MMGSPLSEVGRDSDETQHNRKIGTTFYLGETEVTQEQWQRVMGENPSNFKEPSKPVESVSWSDCQGFCESTGLRLPSEVEWEYACRAGAGGAYAGELASLAWSSDNSAQGTCPVRQRKANAWGLHDMHGNVWEWVEDAYAAYPEVASGQEAVVDESSTYRVLRGGSWNSDAGYVRSAYRDYIAPSFKSGNVGFRVARTPF